MDKLLDKISSYEIFTNLFPGIIFCLLFEKLYGIKLVSNGPVEALFFYYFIGLIISRVGSLVIEPFLIMVKMISYADYGDYIKAERIDKKIPVLLEINNMYRSVTSIIFCLFASYLWFLVVGFYPGIERHSLSITIIGVFVLILMSYRKQTGYIVKRVSKAVSEE